MAADTKPAPPLEADRSTNGPPVSPKPAGRPAPPRRSRKRRWGLIALIVVPLLLVAAGLYYWFKIRPYESTDDAFIEGNVVPIAPQVSGRVISRLVDDNQAVHAGDLLLEIDSRDYEAQVAQAQASLQAAQTRVQQAKVQVSADQARVEQEQASLTSAQSQAQRAEADLQRYQSVQSSAVSRSQLDLALAQARSNSAAVAVARSRAKAAQAQVSLSQAAIETAAADVERYRAALEQAQLQVSYTKILAPEDGFITHRTVETGAYVQAGQSLLALVPDRIWVVANFKETQLAHMRPGQPVDVHIDAYPKHHFRAHVDSIQRGSGARFSLLPPENASGNYVKIVQRVPVKIVFDSPPDPNLPLGPGMSVEPSVDILAQPRATSSDSVGAQRHWTAK